MQFEAALFSALAQLIGAKRIRTTPYDPQSNGMVERLHRTLKAALMCSPQTPWVDLLPTVLLGRRTTFKDDLQAAPAEMLFGVPLRVPGEFFVTQSIPANQPVFVEGLRNLIRAVKPVPALRHTKHQPFIFIHLARQPGGASKPCCLGQSTNSCVAGSSGSAPPFSSSSRSVLEGSAHAYSTPSASKLNVVPYSSIKVIQLHSKRSLIHELTHVFTARDILSP